MSVLVATRIVLPVDESSEAFSTPAQDNDLFHYHLAHTSATKITLQIVQLSIIMNRIMSFEILALSHVADKLSSERAAPSAWFRACN